MSDHDMPDPGTYEPKGTRFIDLATNREMLLLSEPGHPNDGWICYRHPDGQWVTLWKATVDDLARINAAGRSTLPPPSPPETPAPEGTTEPRCKTCGDTGWVMTYDQIEPGISAPSGEPCPNCDGPPAAPETPEPRAALREIAAWLGPMVPDERIAWLLAPYRAPAAAESTRADLAEIEALRTRLSRLSDEAQARVDAAEQRYEEAVRERDVARAAAPREVEEAREARVYQDAAGRVAVLTAMLHEYQQANRIHNDSEAALFERAAGVLGLPPIPLTLAAALSSPSGESPERGDGDRVQVAVTRRADDDETISFDAPGFTTVRPCVDCGVLMRGGPTRCLPCAAKLPRPSPRGTGTEGGK